jgi:hypothetical protein
MLFTQGHTGTANVRVEFTRPSTMLSAAISVIVLGGPSAVAVVHGCSDSSVFGVPLECLPMVEDEGACR